MKLPFRLQTEPGTEPVLCVDGALDAPGLNLSHWPGNRTPPELRHELSTGSALAFARLAPAEQERLAGGCVAVVNNHYDTDGACSLFALLEPEAALARSEALLRVAAAGDFFQVPDEASFQVDVVLTALADPARSPLDLAGLDDRERHERAYREAVRLLPELLDGALEPHESLWRGPLDALRADRADLAAAALDDLVHLDLALWVAPEGRVSGRAGAPPVFDPGRHALFGATRADRVMTAGPLAGGTTYRLVLGTRSWFELPAGVQSPPPRPDLAALAAELDRREGSTAGDEFAWRAQSAASPSPELWFGRAELGLFEEHAGHVLAPSRLPVREVKAAVLEALRASWVFPDEDDEDDWMDV